MSCATSYFNSTGAPAYFDFRECAGVGIHPRIAWVIVSADDWSPANSLAPQTLNLERAALEKHYGAIAENAVCCSDLVTEPLVVFESDVLALQRQSLPDAVRPNR